MFIKSIRSLNNYFQIFYKYYTNKQLYFDKTALLLIRISLIFLNLIIYPLSYIHIQFKSCP